MHRKFIALIVSTAIIFTGFSASRARAADAKDILGGLAAIALIGAAVHQYKKNQDRERDNYVARRDDHRPHHHAHQPHHKQHYKRHHKPHHVRPLPDRVARYDLPQRCLRRFEGYAGNHPLLGPGCLQKHYKYANQLPQACKVGFWNGDRVRHAYEPRCLRQQGYRVVYRD
ncbi:hypothetical protein FGK63_17680 [Ruegeria sediminis]|uniref:Uncharacterized protein n=1 Tax=Ruegeria sediminis TaxID=2583820 RepID=A0ABY2WTQ9_9RHOB|nr:hypothetical protein [Ruegeria sediminis]TMV04910.1 hypothetical protein FGK63_17680 [Ruegeria sediminis]